MKLYTCLVTCLSLLFVACNQQKNLAYIDVPKVMEKYQGMVDAKKSYQQKMETWQSNIDTLKKELDGSFRNYEKEASKMTSKEAALSRELLKTKEQQYLQYKENFRQKAMEEDRKMTEVVLTKVNVFLKEYGKQKGYAFIFAANGNGSMAYADEKLEITEEVIAKLNQSYKGQ
jgi:outer membrane protein